jgi:hypothetical protein
MASLIVAGVEFASKAALERHCRQIVAECGDGEIMPESGFMLNMLRQMHHSPWEKILPGLEGQIIGVRVRHESAAGLICYAVKNHTFVAYSTGMELDFSWVKCCRGFSVRSWGNEAMRRAVHKDIVSYKKLRFLHGCVVSDASGTPLTWDGCQVDHYPVTYAELRDRFLSDTGMSLERVATLNDPMGGSLLADEGFAKAWVLFHQANATLRLVTPKENQTSWKEPDRHGRSLPVH